MPLSRIRGSAIFGAGDSERSPAVHTGVTDFWVSKNRRVGACPWILGDPMRLGSCTEDKPDGLGTALLGAAAFGSYMDFRFGAAGTMGLQSQATLSNHKDPNSPHGRFQTSS